jgi:membrane-associated phospholipid phosphatase
LPAKGVGNFSGAGPACYDLAGFRHRHQRIPHTAHAVNFVPGSIREQERGTWSYRIAFFIPFLVLLAWDALLYNPLGEFVARRGVDYSTLLATRLDEAIPFVPLLSVPYLIAWLTPPATVVFLWYRRVELAAMHRIYLAFFVLFGVHNAAWFAMPVEAQFRLADWLPHPPGTLEAVTLWIHEFSSPWNSFPSMHVAAPWLIVRIVQPYTTNRSQRWLFAAFGVVAASTVSLKLHYLADVLAGWMVAEAVFRWVLRPANSANWRIDVSNAGFIAVSAVLIAGITTLAGWCAYAFPPPATYVQRTMSGLPPPPGGQRDSVELRE